MYVCVCHWKACFHWWIASIGSQYHICITHTTCIYHIYTCWIPQYHMYISYIYACWIPQYHIYTLSTTRVYIIYIYVLNTTISYSCIQYHIYVVLNVYIYSILHLWYYSKIYDIPHVVFNVHRYIYDIQCICVCVWYLVCIYVCVCVCVCVCAFVCVWWWASIGNTYGIPKIYMIFNVNV